MATEGWQETNLGWQLRLLQTRINEWIELQATRYAPNSLDLSWLDTQWFKTIVFGIFGLIVDLLVIWSVWQFGKFLKPYLLSLRSAQRRFQNSSNTTPVVLGETQWLARSRSLAEQGNYRQACLCLYQAMLEQLDTRGIIPHQPSRTDGEYLNLISQLPNPQPYQTLLIAHQQLCFGQVNASRSLFESCQQAYQEIVLR